MRTNARSYDISRLYYGRRIVALASDDTASELMDNRNQIGGNSPDKNAVPTPCHVAVHFCVRHDKCVNSFSCINELRGSHK
jgi:hypothetical protein